MLRICGTSPQRMKTCGWIGMPGYELLVNKSRSGYMRLRETAAHQDANERGPADSPDFCKLESESRDRGGYQGLLHRVGEIGEITVAAVRSGNGG